jgi:adenylosuccinate synthase
MKGKAEVILGMQWGDEGKGRVVDAIMSKCDVVVRYQGGANAGHTVIVEGKKYVFHILPSGMLYSGKTCVVGNGVVIDPDRLFEELDELSSQGMDRARLIVSGSAHVVMPYHKILDQLEEESRRDEKRIGTTGQGIGPCYVDKFNRTGIRVYDLMHPETLREKLDYILGLKNQIITRIYGEKPISFDSVFERAMEWKERLSLYVGDSSLVVANALEEGKRVLFEGAQGTMLDIDHGTYPYVTSSNPSCGGVFTGTGVGPKGVDRIIGVAKAYCTRVGEGPFPSEDFEDKGNFLREKGKEFGATTGRPRRCGWLDMVALKYAIRVNGATHLALTKLDVLSGLEEIKVCVAYEQEGRRFEEYPADTEILNSVKPVYKAFKGFSEDTREAKTMEDLPSAARDYVKFIEEETGLPVIILGVGPDRRETIFNE